MVGYRKRNIGKGFRPRHWGRIHTNTGLQWARRSTYGRPGGMNFAAGWDIPARRPSRVNTWSMRGIGLARAARTAANRRVAYKKTSKLS